MSENSNISWCTHSWNPVSGCTQVSPGCGRCYAKALTERWGRDFSQITLKPHRLNEPAKYKQPSLVFVNSMSDLFHREIPDEYLARVWQVMLDNTQHCYQILTKRPHRMAHKIRALGLPCPEHIWLGTSVENQTFADNRIPALTSVEAPIRWISAEPLLGHLDLSQWLKNGSLAWCVVGGESGSGRRPADPGWFRQIRDDCQRFGVPLYHKQGNHHRPGQDRELDGRTWDEYPAVDHPALAQSASARMAL